MDNSSAQKIQIQIGQWLLLGILIAVVIATIGGIYYLAIHGSESVYDLPFYSKTAQSTSLGELWSLAYQLTPYGIMQLGVFLLVVTQLLRVGLAGWYFVKVKDAVFVWISVAIFCVLFYSLFWHFGS